MTSIPAPAATSDIAAPQARRGNTLARSTVVFLLACAFTSIVLSLQQPWWFLRLYAPQYPRGLTLVIGLDGFSGDVREIDMLNHYIGMAPLNDAAVFERQYAHWAVTILLVGLTAVALLAKRTWSWLLPALGALFPVGFIADCLYWLYRYGHELDPRAPLTLPSFTPQLFGNGTIGQFMTFARPEGGFWLAVLAVMLLLAASVVRTRAARPYARVGSKSP